MSHRPPRRLHLGALLLLTALCARALVPAGFMLAPVDGALQVVLCDADARAGMPQHHHDHGHHGGDAQHHHHGKLDPTCPYAQSAGPAPLPAAPEPQVMRVAERQPLAQTSSQLHSQFGPSRHQEPRAPPLAA